MTTKVIPFGGVRKRSLVLVKGGGGKVATPPQTDQDRYPRFPPAWVDWLVLGLLLAALNLPSPVPALSIAAIATLSLFLARQIKNDGGEDPNIDSGTAGFLSGLVYDTFWGLRLKRPLERQFPKVRPFDKQIVVFLLCELVLYWARQSMAGNEGVSSTFLTVLLFVVVACAGSKVLMWWDTSK